jgi:hypothetical protein
MHEPFFRIEPFLLQHTQWYDRDDDYSAEDLNEIASELDGQAKLMFLSPGLSFDNMQGVRFRRWLTGPPEKSLFSSFALAYYGDPKMDEEVRRQLRDMWYQATVNNTVM